MRPKLRQIAIVVALTATLTLGVTGFVRAVDDNWLSSVSVQVHERGGIDLSIKVPVFLAKAALHFLPDQVRDYVQNEMLEWGPAVCAAYAELETCPDATLISVESREESIRVIMRGGAVVVDVATDDERVRVAVPVTMVGDVLERLDLGTEL